jgi:cardiolipin synthase
MIHWFLIHVALVLGFLLAAIVISSMLRRHRSPSSTLAWLLAVAMFPYVAVPLYLALGGRKMKRLADSKTDLRLPQAAADLVAAPGAIDRLLRTYGIPDASMGNRLTLCQSGEESYAELVRLIEEASASIFITTFILKQDEVGTDIVMRLTRRAEEGIAVRVVLDGVGSLGISRRFLRPLTEAGGRVAFFTPALHRPLRGRTNLRNHRKMVIVDGRRVLAGGANIAHEYLGRTPTPESWRDLCFVVAGPAVDTYLQVFCLDWSFASGKPLDVPFPLTHSDTDGGDHAELQVVPSGPDVKGDPLYGAILAAIHGAQRRVWIVSPYFVPDEALTTALSFAARRGVDVRILVPEVSNHQLADLARGSYLRDIQMAAGKVLLYTPGMMHAKVMLVDDQMAAMGSANMDIRSLFLNYEVALFVYSASEIRATEAWIQDLLKDTKAGVPDVGFWRDLVEGAARLTAPLL